MKLTIVFLSMFSLLMLDGCHSNSGGSSSGHAPSFLLTAAMNVAPAISGTVTGALHRQSRGSRTPSTPADCTLTYGYACLGWEIFTFIREYDPTTNESSSAEDRICSENMYFELDLAGQAYTNFESSAVTLAGLTTISSPFNFGATDIPGEQYTKAINGITNVSGYRYTVTVGQCRTEGTKKHLLFSIGSNEASGWTKGPSQSGDARHV